MINNVVLVGRLTKPVDLRYTSNGVAVGTFTLAVNRRFTNQQGERETDFINCVIWRKPAENLANYTRKGSLIGIEGHIQTRNYENQQGQRVYVTEVIVENFSFLESKNTTEHRSADSDQSYFGANQQTQSYSSPNNNSSSFSSMEDPFISSGETIDISDDDLPF